MDLERYDLHQVNHQRIVTLKNIDAVAKPVKGCEIHITGLHMRTDEKELFQHFARYGEIYKLVLMMDGENLNRGYAFIRYCERDHASDAIRGMNKRNIRGRRVSVSKSIDNQRLYLTNIPLMKSKEDIKTALKLINIQGIRNVIMDYNSESLHSESAVIEFEDHAKAAIALHRLASGNTRLWHTQIKADWDHFSTEEALLGDQLRRRRFNNTSNYRERDDFDDYIDSDFEDDYQENYNDRRYGPNNRNYGSRHGLNNRNYDIYFQDYRYGGYYRY